MRAEMAAHAAGMQEQQSAQVRFPSRDAGRLFPSWRALHTPAARSPRARHPAPNQH